MKRYLLHALLIIPALTVAIAILTCTLIMSSLYEGVMMGLAGATIWAPIAGLSTGMIPAAFAPLWFYAVTTTATIAVVLPLANYRIGGILMLLAPLTYLISAACFAAYCSGTGRHRRTDE